MTSNLFWFSDEQWLRIEPHLPVNQPGPERKDDRRILSGIMHVMKVGCRWKDCPAEYGPHKTIYNRFARWSQRYLARNIRGSGKRIVCTASSGGDRQQPCQSSPLRNGRKRGAQAQAIGRPKG